MRSANSSDNDDEERDTVPGFLVIALYVPHSDFFHGLVAPEHLVLHGPQYDQHLICVHDHWSDEVRDSIEWRELHPFGVHHQHT